jgi:hypothetical protein
MTKMKHFHKNFPLMGIEPNHEQKEHIQHITHKLHARPQNLITLSSQTPTSYLMSCQSHGAMCPLLDMRLLCRMDLPGPTTSVGTRTDYSVGPWDYPACATRHQMGWSTRTTEEKYSVRKLYMSRTVWKNPKRTRLVLSPYSNL